MCQVDGATDAVQAGKAEPEPDAVGSGRCDNWRSRLVKHVMHEDWYDWSRMEKMDFVKTEVLLGITICFAQIPESVAFAFMAHIKPPIALHAAWVVGLICTLLGGRSAMVNGAEGAFAAIISGFVAEPEVSGGNGAGIELLFPSVMTAGFCMGVVWAVSGQKYITLLAASIMDGFCCGLAIVIGLSQLHPFQEKSGAELWWMLLIMVAGLLTMEFVPKLPIKGATLFPSSLLAILVAVAIEYGIVRNVWCGVPDDTEHRRLADETPHLLSHVFGAAHRMLESVGGGNETSSINGTASGMCRTDVIGDTTKFTLTYPYPFFLNDDYDMALISASNIGQIITQGLLLAIAGVVQGLMTVQVVTSYVKTPADTSAVVWSMGLANLVSGFLGGMGGDAMIGLSTINCLNGGRGRLAPTVTALGVMICVMFAYPMLDYIPVAALSGVMIVVVIHTFKWNKIPVVISAALPEAWRPRVNKYTERVKWLWPLHLPLKVDRWEALVIVVVSVLTILINLVVGVGVGVFMTCLRFAWLASQGLTISSTTESDVKTYTVDGPFFFGVSSNFETKFDVQNDPAHVRLRLTSPPLDYSANEALVKLSSLYRLAGTTFDWSVIGEPADESAAPKSPNGVPVPAVE